MSLILVIDDCDQIRNLYREILEGEGYDVVEAEDGDIGLKVFQQHRPALVITDIFMPNKEGLEVIQTLHREAPGLPVVAISGEATRGFDTGDFLRMAGQFGALKTICKPVRPEELIEMVQDLIGPADDAN